MTLTGKDPRLTPYGGGNFGTPSELLTSFLTPNSVYFVRSNGPVPELDPETWRLTVDGCIANPLSLSLDELQGLPHRTITAFSECAGNSRTRFSPLPEGTPWLNDAIGNATWTGTSLANVLALAGVSEEAVDVVSQGADFADMQRGLPVPVALDPDTLLVWQMNGEPLTVPHGAPVRLLVPRWGGIASTKWLISLTLADRPFTGFYNAVNYVMISENGEKLTPVREMPVKSIITSPSADSTIAAGEHLGSGFAWSGFGGITKVEISTDGGDSWFEAEITERAGRLAWVRFEFRWNASPGIVGIRSRATDERQLTQPAVAAWNAKGYQMNAIQEIPVRVP